VRDEFVGIGRSSANVGPLKSDVSESKCDISKSVETERMGLIQSREMMSKKNFSSRLGSAESVSTKV
jgi:hypothetical protein